MNRLVLQILLSAVAFAAAGSTASAGVNVDIHLGVPVVPAVPVAPAPPPPPVMMVPGPPAMVLIPDTTVYFAPDLQMDLFFSGGFWWTRHDGRWLRARHYRGPWARVSPSYVPGPVLRLPPDYRHAYGRGEHIPYGQWKRNHGGWANRGRAEWRGDRGRD